jgi:DNA mismatch repair ATPase MutL
MNRKFSRFDIEIDENESRIDRRCRVLSYPTISGSHSCVFGIDEIDEILSHLTDTSQQTRQEEHYESSRLRKVFASKACRMSIMIGTDLTKKQMTTVVRHLAQLSKPWVSERNVYVLYNVEFCFYRIVLMEGLQFDMYLILLKLRMALLLMIIIHSNQEFLYI